MIEPLTLTEAERNHPLWLRVQKHLEARLTAQLADLCRDHTEHETAIIRGHIRCLKELIRLGEEPPRI